MDPCLAEDEACFRSIVTTTQALGTTIYLLISATLNGNAELMRSTREEARILQEHLRYLRKERLRIRTNGTPGEPAR